MIRGMNPKYRLFDAPDCILPRLLNVRAPGLNSLELQQALVKFSTSVIRELACGCYPPVRSESRTVIPFPAKQGDQRSKQDGDRLRAALSIIMALTRSDHQDVRVPIAGVALDVGIIRNRGMTENSVTTDK